MSFLLDTHVFLWWITDDRRLSKPAREVIEDEGNELFFSAASGWEIAIKFGLGQLEFRDLTPQSLPEQLAMNSVQPLAVTLIHALHVAELPLHHRDPFDRMLVAQAQVEDLTIVTSDQGVRGYDVNTLW